MDAERVSLDELLEMEQLATSYLTLPGERKGYHLAHAVRRLVTEARKGKAKLEAAEGRERRLRDVLKRIRREARVNIHAYCDWCGVDEETEHEAHCPAAIADAALAGREGEG